MTIEGKRTMEKRFGVVSADGHCRLMHLPFDLWTKRLPRKFQDDAPRVVTGPDGTRQWVVEGRPWSGVGWAGVGRGPVNCYTRAGMAEEPEPGIFRAADVSMPLITPCAIRLRTMTAYASPASLTSSV